MMKIELIVFLAAVSLPPPFLAQSKSFLQAEVTKTIKAKTAKPGDPVKVRAVSAVTLGGVAISAGDVLVGQVHEADPNSVSISFDHVEVSGKKTGLTLSIRAAMMPTGSQNNVDGVAAQTGSIIGMPGVTLQVDDSPQHASKFQSSGKELQLKQGLQLMLAVPK